MIYLNNETKLKELKNKMNKDNICVFIDFDKTITSNGSRDSWDAIANRKVMGEGLANALDVYYQKYGPIELDYTMTV